MPPPPPPQKKSQTAAVAEIEAAIAAAIQTAQISTFQISETTLHKFLTQPTITQQMIRHIADKAASVVINSSDQHSPQHSPPTSPTLPNNKAPIPPLEVFIKELITRSKAQVPIVMATLIYFERLKNRLLPVARGHPTTAHRIFLASLNLANKYLNDRAVENKYWAKYSCVRGYKGFGFSLSDVNLMERQLLSRFDYSVGVSLEDLYTHLEPFLAEIRDADEQERLDQVTKDLNGQLARLNRMLEEKMSP